MARRPAASAEMRSLSFTRSSAAPRTTSSTAWRHHRRERRERGNLVDDAGDVLWMDNEGLRRVEQDAEAAGRFAAPSDSTTVSTFAPARRMISSTAVREGFRPTSSSSTVPPGVPAASAIQNVALEMSPGTASAHAVRRCPPSIDTRVPSTVTWTPNAASARSVWSRVGAGSTTVVRPSVCSPARMTALFTCALGTSGRCSMGESVPPAIVSGGRPSWE